MSSEIDPQALVAAREALERAAEGASSMDRIDPTFSRRVAESARVVRHGRTLLRDTWIEFDIGVRVRVSRKGGAWRVVEMKRLAAE